MCYGSLDPKHQMRETEARVRPYVSEKSMEKQAAPFGLTARVREMIAVLLRKGARDV